MSTKIILLTGLRASVSVDGIRDWMREFGPVLHVEIQRDGDPDAPLALVQMEVSEAQAFFIVHRLSNYWHQGSLVNSRLMGH